MDLLTTLRETQQAFDGVAPAYHGSNLGNPLLEAMRRRVRRTVERHATPGSHLLDLGCGPGTDAAPFAARGYRVTAVDSSPAMAAEARNRVRDQRLEERVDVLRLGIHELDRLAPATFDAAYSNFGPLNCVPDLAATARLIAGRLRRGGVLVASVIGRLCPWEIALFAARRDWARLRVRFAPGFTPVPLEGRIVWTHYYRPSEFASAFGEAGFETIEQRALALFAPPPYLDAFAMRHAALVAALQRLDDVAGAWPVLRGAGDHFLVVMRKG